MTAVPEPWTSSASASLDRGLVTLVNESSFCISLASGDVMPGEPHGVFFRDTRFLSELRLQMNHGWPQPLAAHAVDPFSAVFVLRAPPPAGRADARLLVFRRRYVGQGMREDLVVRNYGDEHAFCQLDLHIDCDFADLFEVKESRVDAAGERIRENRGSRLAFHVRRGETRRGTLVDFSEPPQFTTYGATYEIVVPARGEWQTCVQLTPVLDDREVTPRYRCGQPVEHAMPQERLAAWRRNLPTVRTEHDELQGLIVRSTEDLAALRIFDPEHPDRTVVAAGAPWFMTLFGRDSLLTSWMTMLIDPALALGTLQTLARFQGVDTNPVNEEQPGRILHEMRFGESSVLSLGGGSVYYGSVDSTPLFVMLLGELQRWGVRRSEVDALLPAADRALEWVDQFGDSDDDGFVEYQRASDRGLRNQGWKDSWDSTHFANGQLARAPIALCETQGYVYAALLARANFAVDAGDGAGAQRFRERALDLKRRFNESFWLEEHGWFAMGLDREKAPIDALVSNMGHCLWTGIVDDDKAPIVAKRLVGEELWSGWGIRTLAVSMTRYNPVSYHNGSVWPHDNALCAAGLMRYGLVEEAHRVMEGIVSAAARFGNRVPELFAGLSRDEFPFPVPYPTSCSPQAWAAASPLLFLRSLLGFEPDARRGRLHLAPALPDWIGSLRLDGVALGDGHVSLEAVGDQLLTVSAPPELQVVRDPR